MNAPIPKYKEKIEKVKDCLCVLILEADMLAENEKLSKRGQQAIKTIKDMGFKIDKNVDELLATIIEL